VYSLNGGLLTLPAKAFALALNNSIPSAFQNRLFSRKMWPLFLLVFFTTISLASEVYVDLHHCHMVKDAPTLWKSRISFSFFLVSKLYLWAW